MSGGTITFQILTEIGFPLTEGYVEVVVTDSLKNHKHNLFYPSGLPGWLWWEGFIH